MNVTKPCGCKTTDLAMVLCRPHWDDFTAALDAPPKVIPQLAKLLAERDLAGGEDE